VRLEQDGVSFLADTHLEAVLLPILDAAIDITSADFGNIQLKIAEANHLKIVVQRGFRRPFLEFFGIVSDDTTACGAAMHDARRIIVSDVRSSPIFTEDARRMVLDAGAYACQSTPITDTSGRVLGVISTHFRAPHRPSRRQLLHLDALTPRIAAGLHTTRMDSTVVDVAKTIEEYREHSPKTRVIRSRAR